MAEPDVTGAVRIRHVLMRSATYAYMLVDDWHQQPGAETALILSQDLVFWDGTIWREEAPLGDLIGALKRPPKGTRIMMLGSPTGDDSSTSPEPAAG